ncbi:sensor histidine kinase [Cryobacterium sp. N22]|uniref:sensor histidine kinase n=1 Tax=Cryobacterium sp. N22 TaxID=2048290 RepID=UPI000CE553CD|nr:histidine kinase [Cryobacterium sp. N22]
MTLGERPARRSRAAPLAIAALTAVLLVAATFGVTGALAVSLPIGIIAATATIVVWALVTLRAERDAHEAALAEWAASGAVAAERLQIARDLHDIVSHGLGLITVRAATARHLDDHSEGHAALLQALGDIESASREATVELRRMLGVLRRTDDPAPRLPVESLESLAGLIAGATRNGLAVELDRGDLGDVSPGVQLAITVIVREALANTLRHSGPTAVRVRLVRSGSVITLTVTDAGSAPGWLAVQGAGQGLVGLRERTQSLGGTLVAEPRGRGFRLEARLPDREEP